MVFIHGFWWDLRKAGSELWQNQAIFQSKPPDTLDKGVWDGANQEGFFPPQGVTLVTQICLSYRWARFKVLSAKVSQVRTCLQIKIYYNSQNSMKKPLISGFKNHHELFKFITWPFCLLLLFLLCPASPVLIPTVTQIPQLEKDQTVSKNTQT